MIGFRFFILFLFLPLNSAIADQLVESSITQPASANPELKLYINLKQNVLVSRDHVFVSDLASCDLSNPECQLILDTRLPLQLKAGEKRLLPKSTIDAVLNELQMAASWIVTGPEAIEIKISELVISSDQLNSYLEGQIKNFIGEQTDMELRVRSLRILGNASIIPGDLSISIPGYLESSHLREIALMEIIGNKYFDAEIKSSNQGSPSRFRVLVESQVRLNLPVVRSTILRGVTLRHADFSYEWVNIDFNHLEPIADLGKIVGMQTRKIIRTGSPIFIEDIKSIDLVRRGQVVDAELNNGNLGVKMRARSLGRGALGDRLTIQYLGSRKTFDAVIRGPGKVEVML